MEIPLKRVSRKQGLLFYIYVAAHTFNEINIPDDVQDKMLRAIFRDDLARIVREVEHVRRAFEEFISTTSHYLIQADRIMRVEDET